MRQKQATVIGLTAIVMWSLLALLTIGTAPVPPFLLNTLCFGIGGSLGLLWITAGAGLFVLRGVSWKIYAFGTIGLFGYHALYFTAFRIAPAAETGLIVYLWPLFIVLLSGLLPGGGRLHHMHVLGALIAFAGAALILFASNEASTLPPSSPIGLVLAFLCALIWATYSILSRWFDRVPTECVVVYCLATAALSLIAHLMWEETMWPTSTWGWLSVLALGLGPVGAAFFTWDVGMKKGDIQLLGVAAYTAPLLSTLGLIASGYAAFTPILLFAALLITGGAALAARTSLRKVRPESGG